MKVYKKLLAYVPAMMPLVYIAILGYVSAVKPPQMKMLRKRLASPTVTLSMS